MMPSDPLRLAHSYIFTSLTEAAEKKRREEYRDLLKEYIQSKGTEDENGNLCYIFDEPLFIEDGKYIGLQNQRKVSEFYNEKKAVKLIEDTGLKARCIREVVTWEIDYDELYAANQEGLVTDEEIDSIMDHDVSYALIKMKD